jgi:hypothetical protein
LRAITPIPSTAPAQADQGREAFAPGAGGVGDDGFLPGSVDFFVSYTSADRPWAEWIAWELEATGYSTRLQAWDMQPGSNFVLEMHDAAQAAERTLALISPAFLESRYGCSSWWRSRTAPTPTSPSASSAR